MAKKDTAVATISEKTTALATIDLADSTGGGLEEADPDCFVIPRLKLLQKMSPECDPDNSAYVDGAKPGLFYLLTTGELFDSETGIAVVPAYFQRRFIELVPEDLGGGFRGAYLPSDPVVLGALNSRDEKGRFLLENGNYLRDTRIHYAILLHNDGPQPVVITMASSQTKKSNAWNTKGRQPLIFPDGTKNLKPAVEYRVFRLTSVPESNDQYSWRGYKIAVERVIDPSDPKDVEAVVMARAFREQVRGGVAQVEHEEEQNKALDF